MTPPSSDGSPPLATPPFTLAQDHDCIKLRVHLPEVCEPTCLYRAVVDGGCIFGLVCPHFYLPLVFPGGEGTLCDGRTAYSQELEPQQQQQQEAASMSTEALGITRSKDGSILTIALRKQTPGSEVSDLSRLQPSIFAPSSSGNAEADEEERLMGLAILQNGIKIARNGSAGDEESCKKIAPAAPVPHVKNSSDPSKASRMPIEPHIVPHMRSRIHEASREAASTSARRQAAWEIEESKWDEGMYLDNYVDEDGEIKHLLQVQLAELLAASSARKGSPDDAEMQVHEPHSTAEQRILHLLLLELLLAQAYDMRTTLGDATVESAWTICKLSRSLSSASLPTTRSSARDIVIGAVRRQLTFPLYRSWQLSLCVISDVVSILQHDAAASYTASAHLSALRSILENGSADDEAIPIYLENIVDPLCASISDASSRNSQALKSLGDELNQIAATLTKDEVGPDWDMEALEAAAREALAQGEGGFV